MVSTAPEQQGKWLEHYKLLKQLGDGQFGVAYLATDTMSKKNVCIKIFRELDKATQKTFEAEVQAGTSGLIHPNVIKLLAAGRSAIKVDGDVQGDCFYIVMELCANGESFDYVEAAGGLEDKYARQMFLQLIEGVEYIHQKNIAHRDLKLENCFLDKDCLLKVADFGLQKAFAGEHGQDLRTRCGTPNYMAPELLGGKEPYDGKAVDIFACGSILFILKFAKFAFGQSNDSYYRRLHRDPQKAMADRKISADSSFLDLVLGMTKPEPSERLSLSQVKAHPWMQGEVASKEEVMQHYYSLMPGKKCLDKEHYDAMQEARKAWVKVNRVNRSHTDPSLGYDEKDLKEWCKDANLLNLELKEFHGFPSHTGFYTKTAASHLFVALYEHFALQEDVDAGDLLNMDASKGKVKFTLTGKTEELPADEDDEGEEPQDLECNVTATAYVVDYMPETETKIPKTIYFDFKCKNNGSSRELFTDFVRKIQPDMEKFMEVPQSQE